MRRFNDWLSTFCRDNRGNFGAMFGISATALLMSATMALDVSRMYALHLKLTQAIDAAVLATNPGPDPGRHSASTRRSRRSSTTSMPTWTVAT